MLTIDHSPLTADRWPDVIKPQRALLAAWQTTSAAYAPSALGDVESWRNLSRRIVRARVFSASREIPPASCGRARTVRAALPVMKTSISVSRRRNAARLGGWRCSVTVNYGPSLDAAPAEPCTGPTHPSRGGLAGRIRQPSGRHRFQDRSRPDLRPARRGGLVKPVRGRTDGRRFEWQPRKVKSFERQWAARARPTSRRRPGTDARGGRSAGTADWPADVYRCVIVARGGRLRTATTTDWR